MDQQENKNILTKEINLMTGLCVFDYSPELVKRVIKHFPKWRIYKVRYRGDKNKHFDGIFLSNLKSKVLKVTKEENETISEMYNEDNIEYAISKFHLENDKKMNKFFIKNENHYLSLSPVRMICMPIGTEILNIGVENENFM